MKTQLTGVIIALALLASLHRAAAQGTAFTYQGRLMDGGNPANGSYDLSFSLYTVSSDGAVAAGPITLPATGVTNGLFTVTLDFGPVFNAGSSYWLDISVRTNGGGAFTELSPRQPLTPSPYSIYSGFAAYAGLSDGVVGGTIGANAFQVGAGPTPGQVLSYNGSLLAWTTPSGGGGSNANYTISTVQTVNSGLDSSAMGYQNTASGNYATVAGGTGNTASGIASFVGGGGYDGSTIAGNTAQLPASTAVGGLGNTAFGYYATVVGGYRNVVEGSASFIGGGQNNAAPYGYSVIGGGLNNYAGYSAFVGGGQANQATGQGSVVGGGGYDGFATSGNTAGGGGATVPGGVGNSAAGNYSFAAGHNAQAQHQGAFVWADSQNSAFPSTASDQFDVRAYGGVRFVTGGQGLSGMKLDGYQVLTTASGGGGGGGGITNAWLLTGNYNADPALGNFLGTRDTNALELHVNSLRGLGLDYATVSPLDGYVSAQSINVNGGYWANTVPSGIIGATIAGGGGEFLQFSPPNHFNTLPSPNTVNANFSTVGGGAGNAIWSGSDAAVIAGGQDNLIEYGSQASTISGGQSNFVEITSSYSTIPGGFHNTIRGNGSFAAGRNASTAYDGNFVWGDGTRAAVGSGANRFDVLATGGVNLSAGSGGVSSDSTRGFSLGAANQPLITRGFDVFGGGAGASKAGLGRWGLFMEPLNLVLGIPGDDVPGRSFVVGKYDTSGNYIALTTVSQNGNLACNSLTILGGSDLTEPFQISTAAAEVAQGAVVVIDEENPGHLKLSDQPYDSRVACGVSGANGIHPGIQMQQQGLLEGGKNVALSGRVYVQADASSGAIRPGDLLTTSRIPGHAMKVTDHAKAQGAILGKAMTGLTEGKGMVLVLVTLQ